MMQKGEPNRKTARENLRERLALIGNGLLDVVYPPVCLVCGEWQELPFCAACGDAIERIAPPLCPLCGTPVQAGQRVCVSCEIGPEPPFVWSQSVGHYSGTLRRAIHRLKYEGKTALAEPLGRLLAGEKIPPERHVGVRGRHGVDVVVPVPLHPSRLRQRGFNQAELLAQVVARECGLRLDTQSLRRIRRTSSQTKLSAAQRAANVRGAFATAAPLSFSGQRILLLDDVLTTMATASEAARTLQNAGARAVYVMALARGG